MHWRKSLHHQWSDFKKKINEKLKIEFSKTSIHSVRKNHNYSWSMPVKMPKNEQKYRDTRLNWCARHKNQSWDKIVFTDKWTFYLETLKDING